MSQHRLGPFAGLIVCLSGGSVAAKAQHQRLIQEHGGKKSPELTKSVSHLVIFRQQGQRSVSEKERYRCPVPQACNDHPPALSHGENGCGRRIGQTEIDFWTVSKPQMHKMPICKWLWAGSQVCAALGRHTDRVGGVA